MRITNSMMVNRYKKNLNNSLSTLTDLQSKVASGRNFDKFSQDPINAMRANNLYTNISNITNYKSNVSDANDMLLTAEGAVMDIHSVVDETLFTDCLLGVTGTTGPDEREIISTKLQTVQDSILQTLNTKYADIYVFGGLNTSEAPFSLSENGDLLFRGVNVNTGKLDNEDGAVSNLGDVKVSFGKQNADAFNGYQIVITSDAAADFDKAVVNTDDKTITVNLNQGATAGDLQAVLNNPASVTIEGTQPLNADFSLISVDDADAKVYAGSSAKISDTVDLEALANEKFYVDIGVGLGFNDDNSVNPQTALDISVSGLKFMGYGVDENGLPNNVFSLLKEITNNLKAEDFSYDDVLPYINKLDSQNTDLILGQITRIGVQSNYVTRMETRFDDTKFNANAKLGNVESCDEVEAISELTMQQYAYKVSLQMSANILQSSLLDYLS